MFHLVAGLLAALSLFACGNVPTEEEFTPAPVPAPGPDPVDLTTALEEELERPEPSVTFLYLQELRTFYSKHGYPPLWFDSGGLNPAARELVTAIRESHSEGLKPIDYHLQEIELAQHLAPSTSAGQALLELLLSDAFLALGQHLSAGRHRPAEVDPDWYIEPPRPSPGERLDHLLHGAGPEAVLSALAPRHPQYRALLHALSRYRGLADRDGWTTIPAGPTLHPGERDNRVILLRERLRMTGDLGEGSGSGAHPAVYDNDVETAVRRFQERHGLESDGVLGRETLAALNVPAIHRIRQLVVNLERWRWLPRDFGPRHILVNSAGYFLVLVGDEQVDLEMRVIIGKPYRSTPSFSERMTYLEINPFWYIPPKIAREDILPNLVEDPGYLNRRGIRIVRRWGPDAEAIPLASLAWQPGGTERFPYLLQQDPGPENALGRVKFMLPNRFDIYLHDTPARHLFDRTRRAFSSGCIRVEQPMALAARLLQGADGWDGDRLMAVLESGERTVVTLPEPVPVYLAYLTAWVDQTGAVHFRDDIYGRDAGMQRALFDYARH